MRKKSPQLAEVAEYKFRPLKKNLRNSFKQLRYAAESDKLPDKKSIEQFIDEVNIMVSYPGFGDEFYAPFKSACIELLTLYNSNNVDAFKEQISTIRDLKKQCHNRFK